MGTQETPSPEGAAANARIPLMQTPVDVDRELLQAAKSATGLETERAVVEAGLRLLVQLNAQEKFRELRGKVHWDGDLEESRRSRFLDDQE
jgi:Arc/MetJ family transcription regulator